MIWLYVALGLLVVLCVVVFFLGLCASASKADRLFEDRQRIGL